MISHIGLFYVYDLAGIAMCELSNDEIYNRYHEKGISQTAKDYWLDFLKKRVARGGKDAISAQEQIDKIEMCS